MENINKTNFKTKSFNLFWQFLKLPINANLKDVLSQIHLFKRISLPHDWLIYHVDNLYETSSGWYYKEVDLHKLSTRSYRLYFEGVYHNSTLYVNNQEVGSWKNGYTSFEMDITAYLVEGKNTIIMQVRHEHPNSRWYSGAGIYRNVWWVEKNQNHLKTNGTYITTKPHGEDWTVEIQTNVQSIESYTLKQRLYHQGVLCSENVYHGHESLVTQQLLVEKPLLWSPSNPNLYSLESSLYVNDELVDQINQKIGFKHILMDADKGLFVNGKHLKIRGVCEHHDLGLMGAAFSRVILKKRMQMLKDMGVNAIRTAHSVPSPDLMDLADLMGFLIVSEAFDIWEREKNPFDYARFFKEWVDKDVESWITRDRNHVSMLMWSIGNEIYDTHVDEHGLDITRRLVSLVSTFDPEGHAKITIGSNFMMGELTQKCTDEFKVAGYNYGESLYLAHHEKYPDWKIYGSETSSILQSRGIYHFPLNQPILADDDQQCSSLGNSSPSWGATSFTQVLTFDRDLPFSLGQFIWTGFDYLGEPTPYETISSHFGQIDTAGFKKDSYYVYQSAWTDGHVNPMIHLFPYWNFNEGEMIDVLVCTNAHHFKLFLNNQLIDEKNIDMATDQAVIPSYQIPFKKGTIKAIAYHEQGVEVARDEKVTFGEVAALKVTIDKEEMNADGSDLAEIVVETVDEFKNIVENSRIPIKIEVDGPAKVLGLINGDSTDITDYKSYTKNLFSGKLKIAIGATYQTGEINILIKSPGLTDQKVIIVANEVTTTDEEINEAKKIGYDVRFGEVQEPHMESSFDFIPIEQIELSTKHPRVMTKDHNTFDIHVKIHPKHATKQDITWKVVSEKGIPVHLAEVIPYEEGCMVKAKGDGRFIVRAMVRNQKTHPDVVSNLLFEASGLGTLQKNPYELIIAGLYDRHIGDIKVGQEQGAALNQAKDTVIFDHLDFGKDGSNTITLSIFAFESKPLEIKVYDGDPRDENTRLIDTLHYHKETIWNLYQDERYVLSKPLQGIKSIGFEFDHGVVHFKGFMFEKQNRAYEKLSIEACDEYYGDQLTKESWGFSNIGNNVSFKFEELAFYDGVSRLEICGYGHHQKNAIRLQMRKPDQSVQMTMIEFESTDTFETQSFDIPYLSGVMDIELIFLPGSKFDFKWLKFSK